MSRVLVAHGTKHGATAEIAERIGTTLRDAGHEADEQTRAGCCGAFAAGWESGPCGCSRAARAPTTNRIPGAAGSIPRGPPASVSALAIRSSSAAASRRTRATSWSAGC